MKKGFTLIELLAVIVILAIIAVITVPKVAEMIDSSREGAAQDAFYGMIKTAELGWTKGLEKDKTLTNVTCTFSSEGASNCSNEYVTINSSGKNASSGKVTLDATGAAEVYAEDSLLFNGYYCCGTSSKTYCKRNSVPEVSETNGICKSAGGGSSTAIVGGNQVTLATSGDGLYTDPVETGRYVYKGANPSNYIWLDLNGNSAKTDNEIFRIMSVEADNTIKVVAQNSIGNMYWDLDYSAVIDGVTSANSIEGTRYSSTYADFCGYTSNEAAYTGCNAWGSSTTTLDSSGNNVTAMPRYAGSSRTYTIPTNEAYLNTYLNTTYLNSINATLQNKIMAHTFNVGPLKEASGQTLETDISQESAYKWNGKIGLMNVTDYVRASTNTACTSVYEYSNTTGCYNNSTTHNYLFHSAWTLSPYSYESLPVWIVRSDGELHHSTGYNSRDAFPSFYLSSDITLSGSGTDIEPYEIVS